MAHEDRLTEGDHASQIVRLLEARGGLLLAAGGPIEAPR
jgi:hypothetical protein